MKKLSYLESSIIAAIAETHPYSTKEVELIYRWCKSYDKTIQILDDATATGITTKAFLRGQNAGLELLDKYSKWLERNSYMDTDWRTEEPFAIDEFMKDTFKKPIVAAMGEGGQGEEIRRMK